MSFVPLRPDERPQDPGLDGKGWTFQTMEHTEDSMPQAVVATDLDGRWCVYVPLMVDCVIVRPNFDRVTRSSSLPDAEQGA